MDAQPVATAGSAHRRRPHPRLARGDRLFALDQEAGALDDRHVDHRAVDGDRADPVGQGLVIGGDDSAAVLDFGGTGAEFLVEDLDLTWVDHRRAAVGPSQTPPISEPKDAASSENQAAQPARGATAGGWPVRQAPGGAVSRLAAEAAGRCVKAPGACVKQGRGRSAQSEI